MKILVLYDIHGNVDALDAVLSDPRAADPDIVVVGGDAVPGPFALETVRRLDALSRPVRWVRGNGEREVAAATEASRTDEDDVPGRCARLNAAALGADRARRLGELPLTIELGGTLFCHASPRRDDEMLTRISSAERWSDALGDVTSSVVVAGHTHQQEDRRVGNVRVLNAGSVGLPYEGEGAARWLWIADGRPELRHTSYDAARAGERMLATGWPDRDSVLAALVDPVDPLVVTRWFEESAPRATEA